jgi:hypothetical protein
MRATLKSPTDQRDHAQVPKVGCNPAAITQKHGMAPRAAPVINTAHDRSARGWAHPGSASARRGCFLASWRAGAIGQLGWQRREDGKSADPNLVPAACRRRRGQRYVQTCVCLAK